MTNDEWPATAWTLRRPAAFSSALRSAGSYLKSLVADEGGGELVGAVVGGGLFLGRLVVGPDDERGPRLVDQDAVGLVDDRVVVGPLDGRSPSWCSPRPRKACSKRLAVGVAELEPLQLVAEEVEAELLAGAVGDVAGVGGAAGGVGLAGLDAADGQAEQLVDRRVPVGVALGEVVVDGDDVDALALQGVEVRRQGGDQGLALAGLHLGDAAVVDRRAADELDVVVPLLDRPLGRLADQGERLDEQAVERVALPGLELQGRGSGP